MIRKCFVAKEHSTATDFYDIFIEYLQSTLVLDLIATVPNVFGGLNPKFAFFKILRIHEMDMLYYIFKIILLFKLRNQPKSVSDDYIFVASTLCQIIIILHYLSCLWIYVGSEAFIDYDESGALPW